MSTIKHEARSSAPTILRRAMAFIAAPAAGMMVAALCFQGLSAAMGIEIGDRPPPESLFPAISYLLGTYCIVLFFVIAFGALPAYAATILVGVPLHVWFEMRDWRAPPVYLALGAALSLLALMILQLQVSVFDMAEPVIPSTLVGGLAGGVVFRRICFRRWFTPPTRHDLAGLRGILPNPRKHLSLHDIDDAIRDPEGRRNPR
jgi:hypothetical protein